MNKDMKNILKASFDTELTPDQTLGLNNALKNSPELEAEKIKLNKIRLLMKNYSPVFSNEFLDQVMYKIREERRLKASRTLVIAFQRIAFPLLAIVKVFQNGYYFSNPNTEDVFDAIYNLMCDVNPLRYPNIF
jgi:anti-sigma factor RsiW